MTQATIIVLNAVGSVGKSSTAQAFQSVVAPPFLHVQGDAFIGMLPARLWNHPDGICIEVDTTDGRKISSVTMGPVVDRLLRGMRSAVAALAREGNDIIVDGIMLNVADQHDYRNKLAGMKLYFVGLHAPLPVVEQRERKRGDRYEGIARWQAARVHRGIEYDLEIDTSVNDPTACAWIIADRLNIPVD